VASLKTYCRKPLEIAVCQRKYRQGYRDVPKLPIRSFADSAVIRLSDKFFALNAKKIAGNMQFKDQ